jgi:outer membrane murein-binding lipoprotein Lpp
MAGMDGKTEEDGIDKTANLDNSNPDGGQQSSNTGTETATLKALQDKVDALARSLQSDKDKGIARTNQRIDRLEGDIKEVLRTAVKSGKSTQDLLGEIEQAEEAESRQALLEMAQAFKTGKFPASMGSGSAERTGVDVSSVIRELELDPENIQVKAFLAKGYSSESEAYREGAKLIKSLSKQPSDADLPGNIASGRPVPNKNEALLQEYEQKAKDLRGQALINLKMQYRKKGLREIS